MSDSDPIDPVDDGGEDDLFGDDDAGAGEVASENELASDRDDDQDGEERADERHHIKEKVVMGLPLFRHRIPKPQDGMVSRDNLPPRSRRHQLTKPSPPHSSKSSASRVSSR